MKDLIERLRLIYEDDHERGCDGRCYACSCGYDEANEATAKEAAEALSTQAARIAELETQMMFRRATVLDPSTILRDEGE